MKKVDKKNVAIVLLSLIILGSAGYYLFGHEVERLVHRWQNPHMYDSEETADQSAAEYYGHPEVADAVYSCERLYFYGDMGYMTKGSLLDQTAAAAYSRIPDTLLLIHYGEEIQQTEQKGVSFYETKARFSPVKIYPDNPPLTTYLRLAEQGKVEYLKLSPNKRGSLEVEDECDFRNEYANYFDPDVSWQRDTPLAIKEVLLEFFKSNEGSSFAFVNDRRNTAQVYRLASFTGLNQYTDQPKQELAVVLSEKNSTGNVRERIIVIGFDDANKGRILFNEVFYSKILFTVYKDPYALPKEAVSLAAYAASAQQLIELKTNSDPYSSYLYYDKEFDTMIRKTFRPEDEENH